MKSLLYRMRINVFIGMVLIGVLGGVISYIGWDMGGNTAIISAAGVGAIVAITNLATKILDDDFDVNENVVEATLSTNNFVFRVRPNVLISMIFITLLGVVIGVIGRVWDANGNEAIVSGAGVGAIVAVANLASKILENDDVHDPNRAVKSVVDRLRPNIILAMGIMTTLGIVICFIALALEDRANENLGEGLVAAAGVGSIVAITNLASKIIEKERAD